MSIIYAIAGDGGISAYVDGKMTVVSPDHAKYADILVTLENQDVDKFLSLSDLSRAVNDYLSPSGKLSVKNGQVLYRGIPIEFSFTSRLKEMMAKSLPYLPYVRYIERTMKNPRPRCVASLDLLINRPDAKYPLPLLPDGRFLAYKRVRPDYLDHYGATVLYEPLEVKYKDHPQVAEPGWLHAQAGNRVGMPVWEVDDNFQRACSAGFHAGLYEYVNTFHKDDGPILAVAICPSQVISVPQDARAFKFRTHALEVRHIVPETFLDLIFDPTGSLAAERKASTTRYNDEWSEDYDDTDDDDTDDDTDDDDDDDDTDADGGFVYDNRW